MEYNIRPDLLIQTDKPVRSFKFEHLDIWRDSVAMAELMMEIGDQMETKKRFRFADLIRCSAMNISNRIAEGSGSGSKSMFIKYLDSAKRSVYENANLVIFLQRRGLISKEKEIILRRRLTRLNRKIIAYMDFLRN